jgi:hypothetical protein
MLEHVSFQSHQVLERHIAYITVMWTFLSMQNFMPFPIILSGKGSVTNITSKWTHSIMNSLMMMIQITLMKKPFFTHITDIRTLSSMDTTMSIQSTTLGKGLITYITDVRTLSSMYAHVSCQVALTTETFTT